MEEQKTVRTIKLVCWWCLEVPNDEAGQEKHCQTFELSRLSPVSIGSHSVSMVVIV